MDCNAPTRNSMTDSSANGDGWGSEQSSPARAKPRRMQALRKARKDRSSRSSGSGHSSAGSTPYSKKGSKQIQGNSAVREIKRTKESAQAPPQQPNKAYTKSSRRSVQFENPVNPDTGIEPQRGARKKIPTTPGTALTRQFGGTPGSTTSDEDMARSPNRSSGSLLAHPGSRGSTPGFVTADESMEYPRGYGCSLRTPSARPLNRSTTLDSTWNPKTSTPRAPGTPAESNGIPYGFRFVQTPDKKGILVIVPAHLLASGYYVGLQQESPLSSVSERSRRRGPRMFETPDSKMKESFSDVVNELASRPNTPATNAPRSAHSGPSKSAMKGISSAYQQRYPEWTNLAARPSASSHSNQSAGEKIAARRQTPGKAPVESPRRYY